MKAQFSLGFIHQAELGFGKQQFQPWSSPLAAPSASNPTGLLWAAGISGAAGFGISAGSDFPGIISST